MLFYSIQAFEECSNIFFVCFLCGSKPGFIDAIVDIVVCPVVCGFDLFLEGGGEEVDVAVLGFNDVVELWILPSASASATVR